MSVEADGRPGRGLADVVAEGPTGTAVAAPEGEWVAGDEERGRTDGSPPRLVSRTEPVGVVITTGAGRSEPFLVSSLDCAEITHPIAMLAVAVTTVPTRSARPRPPAAAVVPDGCALPTTISIPPPGAPSMSRPDSVDHAVGSWPTAVAPAGGTRATVLGASVAPQPGQDTAPLS
ncbi:hypothetical protein [Streptomyces sp. NPDC060022]|uniref:hypothetical protein n=1 Tax=Streptomyces sp. NPDC060022 TaxID=3347039 RepID=UPI0036B8932F